MRPLKLKTDEKMNALSRALLFKLRSIPAILPSTFHLRSQTRLHHRRQQPMPWSLAKKMSIAKKKIDASKTDVQLDSDCLGLSLVARCAGQYVSL